MLFIVRTGHYLEDGAFTRFASRDKLQPGWEFDFCLFQAAILEFVFGFDDLTFIRIVCWIKYTVNSLLGQLFLLNRCLSKRLQEFQEDYSIWIRIFYIIICTCMDTLFNPIGVFSLSELICFKQTNLEPLKFKTPTGMS